MYEFLCNMPDPPYPVLVKSDDNSRFFADRCSYDFKKLTKDQANAILKKQIGKSIDEIMKGESLMGVTIIIDI